MGALSVVTLLQSAISSVDRVTMNVVPIALALTALAVITVVAAAMGRIIAVLATVRILVSLESRG